MGGNARSRLRGARSWEANVGSVRGGCVDVVLQDQKTCSETNFDSVELPFACGMQGKYRDETCPIISRGHWRH